MAFPQIGLEAIFKNAAFLSGMREYQSAIGKGEQETTTRAGVMNKAWTGLAMVGGGAVAAAGIAIGAAVTATAGFMASSIGPASDLGESINAVNVVFEDGAGPILEYGKTAFDTVGMSNRAFNSMATTTGAFLQNVGFDMNTAGTETIKLTERAADMASVFNTDVSTAMAAVQSGLKGEFNPLEQFGVKLNADAIAARALSMGLGETTVDLLKVREAEEKATDAGEAYNRAIEIYGDESEEARRAATKHLRAQENLSKALAGGKTELTDNEKATAALALIYEQTAKVEGDFANTSTSLANSKRRLLGLFEDIQAKIGGALLPALEQLAGMLMTALASPEFQTALDAIIAGLTNFINTVVAGLPQVIQWFQNAFGWLQENEGVVVAVLAVIGAAVAAFVYAVVVPALIAFTTAAAPVVLAMGLIGAAAYILYEAWTNNWGGIREKLTKEWNAIMPVLQKLWDWLSINVPAAIETLVGFWENTLLPAMESVWDWVQTNLIPLWEAVSELLSAVVGLAVTALAGIWENVLQPALEVVGGYIADTLSPVFEDLSAVVETVSAWVGDTLAGAFSGVTTAIQDVIKWIEDLTTKLLGVKLPEWMTPGSPTPWEVGLVGVSDAMKQLATIQLPRLDSELNATARGRLSFGGMASAPTPSAATTNVANNFNFGGNNISSGMDWAIVEARIIEVVNNAIRGND